MSNIKLDEKFNFQDLIISDRDKEIAEIKRDMTEVNQLFKLIASEIDHQGNTVDNIQSNIKNAKNDCESALEEIVEAEKESEKTQSLYLYILGGAAGVAGITGSIVGLIFLL